MFKRSKDFKNASKHQLEVWQKNFPSGTVERQEIRDELQYREYAWMYGEMNAYEMMNVLLTAREKYDNRKTAFDNAFLDNLEIDWDSLPPVDSNC